MKTHTLRPVAEPHAHPVEKLSLADAVADVTLILDGSDVDVDGITASADPVRGLASSTLGTGDLLVTFTDAAGHRRVAEVHLTARWVESFCWHLRSTEGVDGPECADCGMCLTDAGPVGG